MGKYNRYIKRFSTEAEFLAFKSSEAYIEPNLSFITESNGFHFDEPKDSFEPRYLTFELMPDHNEFDSRDVESHSIRLCYLYIDQVHDDPEYNFEYSIDNGTTWNECEFAYDDDGGIYYFETNSMNVGDIVMFRGNNEALGLYDEEHDSACGGVWFELGGYFNCSGDVTSLLNGRGSDVDLSDKPYCFANLFGRQSGLLTAPNLPSTKLGICCYCEMFSGCDHLGYVYDESNDDYMADNDYFVELPATTLVEGCYEDMFSGILMHIKCWCTSVEDNTYPGNCVSNMINNGHIDMKKSFYETYVQGSESWISNNSGFTIYDIDTNEKLYENMLE